MLRVADVSVVQGNIDWPAVAASGVSFAICKVAEGDGYRDPHGAQNLAGARSAGLVVGPYCVVRPSMTSDPAEQARTHYGAVQAAGGGLVGDLPAAVDFELDGGLGHVALAAWLEAHCAEMERLLGRPPLLYTYPSFWAPLAAIAGPATARSTLWWASYGADTGVVPTSFRPPNPVPLPWGGCRFWQHTDRGRLPGGGAVDGDLFDGSLADLQSLALTLTEVAGEVSFVPPDPTA